MTESRGVAPDALFAHASPRIRLHWFAGYVSDYTGPLDEDTRALLWEAGAGKLTLHASTGHIHHFSDSGQTDDEGYAIYPEDPNRFHTIHAYSPNPRDWLRPEQTFAYTASVPAAGESWTLKSRDTQVQLLGVSPRLHIEPVGILRGGEPVSPDCDLIRPAVSASRIVLTRDDATGGGARAAWFHLEDVFVNSLRRGDVVNITRTQRSGLGVSVIREGKLLVAVGAVTAVPIGSDFRATLRRDLLTHMISLGGGPAPWLPTFQFTTTDLIPRRPKGYSARVWCCPLPRHERDECVSIVRDDLYRMDAAASSALLLSTSDALYIDGAPAWV